MKNYYFGIFALLIIFSAALGYTADLKIGEACQQPGTPTGINAADGTSGDHVYISWSSAPYAEYYEVFRATEGAWEFFGKVFGTYIYDHNAIPGQYYDYAVQSWNSCGYSLWSESDTGHRACPTSGATVQASDGTQGNGVMVEWNDQPYSTRYDVYRSETTYPTDYLGSTQNLSWWDSSSSLIPGKDYYYWVYTVYEFCPMVLSDYDIGWKYIPVPDPPTGVSASDGTFTDRVRVTWNPVPNAHHYILFVSTPAGPSSRGSTNATMLDDTSCVPGTTYSYAVKALNRAGASEFSLYDTGYCEDATPSPPDPPTGVSASDGTYTDRVRVTWSASSGATSYTVYRAASSGGSKSSLGTTASTQYNDTTAVAGTTYYYWVTASNTSGPSGYSSYDTGFRAEAPGQECIPDDTTLCLNNGRFKVQVAWENELGQFGSGHLAPYGSDDSGVLWFFSESNWEMLVKVLNGCGINDRFWVFFAATTDQKFILTVTDTLTGESKQYINEMKNPADAVTDTSAFATCSETTSAFGLSNDMEIGFSEPTDEQLYAEFESSESFGFINQVHSGYDEISPIGATEATSWQNNIEKETIFVDSELGDCLSSETAMCLNEERFKVTVDWKSEDGRSGSGKVVPYGTDDSGMFWFFNESNWEMLVKVLNGCSFNENYWVFFAATTDQEFTVTVTDTLTQEIVQYTNPMKHPANAVTDTSAFATCP